MLCYHAEVAKDSQFCTRAYFPMWLVKEHFSPEGMNINEAWGIGRTSPDPFLLWVGSGHETTTEMSFLIDDLAHEVVDGTRYVSTKQGPPVRFACTDISSILIVYFKSIQWDNLWNAYYVLGGSLSCRWDKFTCKLAILYGGYHKEIRLLLSSIPLSLVFVFSCIHKHPLPW